MLAEILNPMERVSPARLPEEMERRDCDSGPLRDALETLARANGRFGTRRMTVSAATELLTGKPPGRVRVLDVGTGSGDIGASVAAALEAGGWRPTTVLADLHPLTLRLARRRLAGNGAGPERPPAGSGDDGRGLSFVRLTAPRLPFASDSFDLVVSSTMLHHLERRHAVGFLREVDRVAADGWVVTDLHRSRPAYLAVRLLAATLWRRHPLPRRDGPVSVRRAFTGREVRDLLEEAGIRGAAVERLWPFRIRVRGGPA